MWNRKLILTGALAIEQAFRIRYTLLFAVKLPLPLYGPVGFAAIRGAAGKASTLVVK